MSCFELVKSETGAVGVIFCEGEFRGGNMIGGIAAVGAYGT